MLKGNILCEVTFCLGIPSKIMFKKKTLGCFMAQLGEHAILDLGVMSADPTLGVELTLRRNLLGQQAFIKVSTWYTQRQPNSEIFTEHFFVLGPGVELRDGVPDPEESCKVEVRGKSSRGYYTE